MYPQNTHQILKYLYPDASSDDFMVIDAGSHIDLEWDRDDKKPTAEEVIAASKSEGFKNYLSNLEIKHQMDLLESHITPRRLREAILGVDGGWLATADSQIAHVREQLK